MIIVMKNGSSYLDKERVYAFLRKHEIEYMVNETPYAEVVVLVSVLDDDLLQMLKGFDSIISIESLESPFCLSDKRNSCGIVKVKDVVIGDGICLIAGPCTVQSENQLFEIAENVVNSGASVLRGGAFKPRTSPYSFRGMGKKGIELLIKAGKKFNVPVVTELTDIKYLDMYDGVDIIQVGARNMQNFELLTELGRSQKPVLLKRGFGNTLEEFLFSVEYLLKGGNSNVILCERGIRTFEHSYRNTLDISAVAYLKNKTYLPVIADPSHACGIRALIEPLSLACVAAGADGLMIEVDGKPEEALCDAHQALGYESFKNIVNKTKMIAKVLGE